MRKLLQGAIAFMALSFVGFMNQAIAQNYTIDQGGVVQACSGKFYDSGDSTSSYSNNENYNITFQTGLYGMQIQLDFTSFQLESCCDYLTIYDGTDNTGTQLYYGNGSNSPGTVVSTTGALYVTFTSDGSVTYSGWEADISCVGTAIANEVSTNGLSLPSCGDSRVPISANFHNGGTADIVNADVYYIINGTTIVSETINDTIFSGTTYNYTFNQLADLSASGTYNVDVFTYVPNDPDLTNDTSSATISFQAIDVNVNDTFLCEADNVVLTALGNSNYIWYNDNDFTSYIDTTSSITPYIDSSTVINVYESDNVFYVQSLTTNGAVVDHNSLTGDDRGGVAITDQFFYVVGDNNTARYDAATLTNGVSLPMMDGLFSDLGTGDLYTLSNSVTGLPSGSYVSSYMVDEIGVLDTALAIQSTITLSQSITMGGNYGSSDQAGIYAGAGYVILYTGPQGNNWYRIDLPSGNVTLLNTFLFNTKRANENWSHWGFASFENGSYHVNYRELGTSNISKINLTNQNTTVLHTYTNLNDMASITYSPWLDRMYFHHEGSSEFGSGSEMGGYVEGSSLNGVGPAGGCPAKIYVNISEFTPDLGPDTTVCEDVNYALNPGAFDSYSWSTGSTSSQIVPASSDAYIVTTTDMYGCVKNDTVNLTVNPRPELDLGNDTNLCEGSYLDIDATDNMVSYIWSNGSTDQTLIVNGQGVYSVTVVDANGCINEDEVQVTSAPVPAVDLGGDTVIGAYSEMTYTVASGYSSYLWSTADTTPSTTFIISNNQYLSVSVTDINGCVGEDEIFIQVLLGTDDMASNNEMNLYPNPASQQVYLDLAGFSGNDVDVTLIDVTGRVVYQTVSNSVSTPINIPVEHLTNGVYTVVVKADNKVIGQKKVVKN